MEEDVKKLLVCPACGGKLAWGEGACRCANVACCAVYAVEEGVPILICEGASLFGAANRGEAREAFFAPGRGRVARFLDRVLPDIAANVRARANYRRLATLLKARGDGPLVLVLGGGERGVGTEVLADHTPPLRIVRSDVFAGANVDLACDAHRVPFAAGVFDAVIAQAVLEHVVSPDACVEEMWRVLKPGGLVYAETAFLQPVHGAPYDFTRFTYAGHRRLFRKFESVAGGVACGPGMALAWSYQSFLRSFAGRGPGRKLLTAWSRLTAFYLKYFDYFLAGRPGAREGAAAYYFLGRKTSQPLTEEEIIKETS